MKMEAKTEDANRVIAVELAQECVVGNEKVGSLNMRNCDVGSDDVNNTVYTREITRPFESTEVSGRGSGMKNKNL